jgi:predicted CXXCH cytochrome family protein
MWSTALWLAASALSVKDGSREPGGAPAAVSSPSPTSQPTEGATQALARGSEPDFARRAASGIDALGAACVDCHREIVRSWRDSPMGCALRPLVPSELDGLVPLADPRTGFRYSIERRGERGFAVEEWLGADGQPVAAARNEAELAFAIGAGIADTSYAARRDGLLWFAPLEVLSPTASSPRRAVFAPGQSITAGLRFGVPIPDECLGCHTDALPRERFPLNREPEPEWIPRGMDCAHCHPAAAAHAEHQGSNAAGADPIVAAAPRDAFERVSSCARCHLQGDARVPLGNDPGAHRGPGGDLLAKLAVFTGSDADGEIPFVSQVERMLESRCFRASLERAGPAFVCETCHDPHASVFEPRERARVRAACTGCHANGVTRVEKRDAPCSIAITERGARECVDCHARRTAPFDVAGVEIFDHAIARRPLAPSKIAALRIKQSRGEPTRRFRWPGRAVPLDGDPGLALLAAIGADQPERAREFVDAKPDQAVERLASYQLARGGVLQALGRFDDARKAFLRAKLLDPHSVAARIDLGLALAQCGKPAEALVELDAVVREHPDASGALRNRSLARLALGDFAGARADLEAAHASTASTATALALAELARRADDRAAYERWLAAARALDPRGP